MRISFYTPFKPLDHANPSGDLMIARGLYGYLKNQDHKILIMSNFRSRWVFWKPWIWTWLIRDTRRIMRTIAPNGVDLWFTYHSYYKAPDLLGSFISRRLKIPYVIFQGIYSTKRKRDWKTWPGFVLNRAALCAADHVFSNKKVDYLNMKRLLPSQRITYVKPGISPHAFSFDAGARDELKKLWDVGDEPVVLSAAMFRPDVKTQGLSLVIRVCGELFRKGLRFYLVIAGEGRERNRLLQLAKEHLPGRVRFVGKIPRNEMYRFYSAGDIFAFPGIRESLGMVFLEAQSCGIPVVAFANGGIPEVVRDGETGFLVPLYDSDRFAKAIEFLLTKRDIRQKMGQTAQVHVREGHDIDRNYQEMKKVLEDIVIRKGTTKKESLNR
ncbi:MAG: glycosyltransferase [Desulfobacteraceae bacterium]|nr:MAG: glycosyltransferase [Desulfobacteraceae bacterium]